MKRMLAMLLCAIMLLAALPVLGAEYTLDEKLYKQVKDGSGLRATLKFEKTGGAFSVLAPEANALLGALLPGSELSLRYLRGVGTMKGQEEMELTLQKGGQPLGDFRLLKDSQFEQLTSAFFGAARYVDRRDGGLLAALLTGQDPTWPPVEGVLIKLNSAESTWQGEVARKLDAYSVKLNLWLQGYTTTENLRDNQNRPQTRFTTTVPAAQVKAQVKQLLLDAYSDTELLALLAREMDARQAAAYLQPAMMNSFFQSLDRLPLTGNLVAVRLLDSQGQVIENSLTLPLGGARGLDRALYRQFAQADGVQTSITLEYSPKNTQNQKGAVTSLVYKGGPNADSSEFTYTGTLSLQPEAGGDAFTVDAAEGDTPASLWQFNLLYAPGEEVRDQANDTSTRAFEFALRLVPQGDTALAAQHIKAAINLQSRQNSRSATYFTGTLTWLDEGSQALMTANVSGNTAPPWAMPVVDTAGAVRVDSLTAAQLASLRQQVQTTLQNALASLTLRQLTPATTTP